MSWYENLAEGEMVLAEGQNYSLDCYKTRLNNNVLVCGTSGAGKTRTIVTPNLLMASGSYIVSDPKGNLYNKWKNYLEEKGYEVKKVDFTRPKESMKYNPLTYANSEYKILKLAHQLAYQDKKHGGSYDPYWDAMDEQLICALIAYLVERGDVKKMTITEVLRLARMAYRTGRTETQNTSMLKTLFEAHRVKYGDTLAVRMFDQVNIAPDKTFLTIVSTLNASLGKYEVGELVEMMSGSEIDFREIGKKKTAFFVVVSDTDRTLDGLANIFFSQAMNELCDFADQECEDNRLPVPVRFILDDFATNVKIDEFPRMISSIRSRGISTILMIQAESQLTAGYGDDGKTIIANCDTYVYMGTNELCTMEQMAKRCNVRLEEMMMMPISRMWIFRRGHKPVFAKNIDYDSFLKAKQTEKEKEF